MQLHGKRVDLVRLGTELLAAGIPTNGLGIFADELFTFDADGAQRDLPAEAQPVVDAHDPSIGERTTAFETAEDAERLRLIAERAKTDPAFRALSDLTLGTLGVQT